MPFLIHYKKQSVSVSGKPGLTETDCFSFVLLTAPVRWNGKKAVLLSDELSIFNAENPAVPFIQGGTVADADDRCAG